MVMSLTETSFLKLVQFVMGTTFVAAVLSWQNYGQDSSAFVVTAVTS